MCRLAESSHLIEQPGLFQLVSELGAEDRRESFDREEKIRPGRFPIPVFGQPAASDDVVNVRMVDQISGPGVEHADHADATADEPWIESQLLQSLGGSAKQNVVERLLICTCQGP